MLLKPMVNKNLQKLYWLSSLSCLIWTILFLMRFFTYPEKFNEILIIFVDYVGALIATFMLMGAVTESFFQDIAKSALSDFNRIMFRLFISFVLFYLYKELRESVDHLYWKLVYGVIEWLMFGVGIYLGSLLLTLAPRNRKVTQRRNRMRKNKGAR
ncbi:hypothetical protein P7M32_01210 [Bisgaard Taxon 10/6]|uniref:Uncharacterized protein n=1 Tax=Exercitatus varius TaxID=67857 RepID=A0ABT6ENE1_9PAST|nr:hypothetical protein [Exercitatus varius]MDG2939375.1 hypothetical protein [Exercitatus varius]MDG2945059.1 hypothetical protein [Exercitatus varius]